MGTRSAEHAARSVPISSSRELAASSVPRSGLGAAGTARPLCGLSAHLPVAAADAWAFVTALGPPAAQRATASRCVGTRAGSAARPARLGAQRSQCKPEKWAH